MLDSYLKGTFERLKAGQYAFISGLLFLDVAFGVTVLKTGKLGSLCTEMSAG